MIERPSARYVHVVCDMCGAVITKWEDAVTTLSDEQKILDHAIKVDGWTCFDFVQYCDRCSKNAKRLLQNR